MRINLAPWREKNKNRSTLWRITISIVCIGTIITGLFLLHSYWVKQKNDAAKIIMTTEKLIQAISIKNYKQQYEIFHHFVQESIHHREELKKLLTLIYDICQNLPGTLNLTSITWKNDNLILQGESKNTQDFYTLSRLCKENKHVLSVSTNQTQKAENTYTFNIELVLVKKSL